MSEHGEDCLCLTCTDERTLRDVDRATSSFAAPAGSAATVTIGRPTSGDGQSRISIEAEWQGNRLKLEMALDDFALAVTGRGASPATVSRWRRCNGKDAPSAEKSAGGNFEPSGDVAAVLRTDTDRSGTHQGSTRCRLSTSSAALSSVPDGACGNAAQGAPVPVIHPAQNFDRNTSAYIIEHRSKARDAIARLYYASKLVEARDALRNVIAFGETTLAQLERDLDDKAD